MIFRPLCIDYHSRAQEIVIAAEESSNNNNALRLLPTPPNFEERNLYDELEKGDGDTNDGDDRIESSSNGGSGDGLDENGETSTAATTTTNENENNNIMMDKSMKRIQTIMTLLGPAVHPSEMAYRSIEPLSKGPIRGTLLPIPPEQQCNNTTMKVVTNILSIRSENSNQSSTSRKQFCSGGGISALLESGRSRLIHNNSSSDNNNELASTFVDTMNIVYNDNDKGNNDKEISQHQSQVIWNQHVNNLPMPKSIYLKHDSEDDLDKIHALKSLRMTNSSTNFADMTRTICKPKQLGTLKSVGNTGQRKMGLQLVESSGNISTKPSFDMSFFCSSKPIKKKKEDFASRLNSTVPFTKFLDDDDDNITKEADSVSVVSLPGIITLDPIFDPLHKSLPSKKLKPPIKELIKPLNEMCSASSISARLNLPGRFIKSHETIEGLSCYLLPLEKNQFDFLDKTIQSYKDSVISEEDESMLPKSMSMTSNNAHYQIPQKICPDTDIDPFQVKPKSSKPSKTIRSSILSLPSFSGMISFGKTRKSSIDVAGIQRRSVQSSSHVSNVDSLQKVMANSNKASCLFLSQTRIERVTKSTDTAERRKLKMEEQKSTSNRLLSDAIRSSVPSTIQAQCSDYPVAPWFDSEKDVASSTDNISEIDIALLNLKRKTFCHNAKARSSGEGSRTLLLTGCSSRRNAEYKYSYRGLVTNQAVSARVFERRYNAMLQLNKSYDHRKCLSSHESSSGEAKHLLNDESFFSRMALGIFVEAFSRHKDVTKKSSKARISRSAPYAFKLNTKRHGKFQITANSNGPKSKRYVSTSKPELLISLPTIDVLAANRKDEESLCGSVFDTVAVLGQQSLKCRGELIHLETKANELEAEQKSYLKELAVVNRGRVNTPKDVPFVESLNNETQIDWSVPDETNMKKRKAGDESATDELNNDERSDDKKKKRKKDKKKKKRKKRKREKRKRKEEEDAASTAVQLGDESKKCKVSTDVDEEDADKNETVTREQKTIELPTMTPINLPPKKKIDLLKVKQLSPPQGDQDCIDQQPNTEQSPTTTSKLSDHSPKQPENSSYSAASTEKSSPDSVAHMLNPDTKPSSSLPEHEHHNDQYQPQQEDQEINHGDTQQQRDDMHQSRSHLTHQQEVEQYHPRTLLTSESFLETFGEVVAELASGYWQKAIDNNSSTNTPTGIVVSDCPLLDIAGVDIELSDASAIIVQNLSSWGDNQNAQKGARSFLRRLVFLCASGRYNAIHVILCLDVEMSAVLSTEIVNLQNACARQSGCPCDYVTFEYSHRPRSVAASIALRAESVSSSLESSQISEFVAEENVQERVRFLVMLIPTMSVHMACKALGFQAEEPGTSQLESGKALQTLFQLAKTTTKDLFPYKMEGILSSRCAEQLWMTLNVDVAQHAFQG